MKEIAKAVLFVAVGFLFVAIDGRDMAVTSRIITRLILLAFVCYKAYASER